MIDIGPFLSQLIVGIYRGSFYWILALGLTLIFGVTRIINFAHAAFLVTGGYIMYTAYEATGDFVLSIIIAVVATGLLGALFEVLVIRRVYGTAPIYQLFATFAITLVLNESQKLVWGKGVKFIPIPEVLRGGVAIGHILISYYSILVMLIGLLLLVTVHYVINNTMLGLKVRAVWRDPTMSSALGINPKTLYTLVFFIGTSLAGLGGALILPTIALGPGLGDHLIVIAFIVVVLAGLGNILGAYVMSLIVGVAWSLLVLLIPELDIVVLYLVAALVLLLRPQGLFGER